MINKYINPQKNLFVIAGAVALLTAACAEPCFDDGLLQDPGACPAAASDLGFALFSE